MSISAKFDFKQYVNPVHKTCAHILLSTEQCSQYNFFEDSVSVAATKTEVSRNVVLSRREQIIKLFNEKLLGIDYIKQFVTDDWEVKPGLNIEHVPLVVVIGLNGVPLRINDVWQDLEKLLGKPLGMITLNDLITLGNITHGFSWCDDESDMYIPFNIRNYNFEHDKFQILHNQLASMSHHNYPFMHTYKIQHRIVPHTYKRIEIYKEYPFNLITAVFQYDKDWIKKTMSYIIPDKDSIQNYIIPNYIDKLLETLTDKEAYVLRTRYKEHKSLREVGETIKRDRERIRQIEAKAFRKLRHPYRTRIIRPVIELLYNDMNNALYCLFGGDLKSINLQNLKNGIIPKTIVGAYIRAMYKYIEFAKCDCVFGKYNTFKEAINHQFYDIPCKHLFELYEFVHSEEFIRNPKIECDLGQCFINAQNLIIDISMREQDYMNLFIGEERCRLTRKPIVSVTQTNTVVQYVSPVFDEETTMRKAFIIYDVENMRFDDEIVNLLLRHNITNSQQLVDDIFEINDYDLSYITQHVFDGNVDLTMKVADKLHELFLITTTDYMDLLDQLKEWG